MCVVIVAGINEAYEVEVGIDSTAEACGHPSDKDFCNNNRGKGKMFPTGLKCKFNGKIIPTLVQWSLSGSITSEILRDTIATLDHYHIFIVLVMNRSHFYCLIWSL